MPDAASKDKEGNKRDVIRADHYAVSTPDYVRTANIVLIDLRSPATVTAGHIPRAVGIPMGKLAEAKDQFPESLTVPIVFYSDNIEDSRKAVEMARGWRYKKVSLLEFPGALAWKEKGYDVKYLKAGCKCNLDGTYLIWEM